MAHKATKGSLDAIFDQSTPLFHFRDKDDYYRSLSRIAAGVLWKHHPKTLIFDMCREISLWLERDYNELYEYNQAVYRWIRDLAPYEPRQTRKPRS